MVGASIEIKGLDRLARMLGPQTTEKGLSTGLDRIIIAVAAEAKPRTPRKTGYLSRSGELGPRTPRSRSYQYRANYAEAVHEGTRPHLIVPRYRKALRWAAEAGGARLTGTPRRGARVIFATRVHHPGTKGQPWLREAMKHVPASDILARSITEVWRRTR